MFNVLDYVTLLDLILIKANKWFWKYFVY